MIYIVEDDRNIREIESYALSNSGFEVESFESGEEFYEAMEQELPELIILDIMLPNEDGLQILSRLRNQHTTKEIPIIMITAKSLEMDKVKALDAGADDYITKPFGVMELVSRVRALLRRSLTKVEKEKELCVGEISINERKHVVMVGKEVCSLTYKEYELLKYFVQNIGIVLTREKIMERVWGFDYEGESRTVDMHVKTLRKKLGEAGTYIRTVRNVGYKIEV